MSGRGIPLPDAVDDQAVALAIALAQDGARTLLVHYLQDAADILDSRDDLEELERVTGWQVATDYEPGTGRLLTELRRLIGDAWADLGSEVA